MLEEPPIPCPRKVCVAEFAVAGLSVVVHLAFCFNCGANLDISRRNSLVILGELSPFTRFLPVGSMSINKGDGDGDV